MNSPAPGGPPTELVPSGDLKRAPASPPSLSRVQEGGLQVSRLALACLSPGVRRPLPSRSQGGRPRGDQGQCGLRLREAAPSFVPPDPARRSRGWSEKCRLRERGPRAPAGDGTLSGPAAALPSAGRSRSPGPRPLRQRRRGQGRPAHSWSLHLPGVLRRCKEHPAVPGGQDVGDGRRAPPRGPRGRCRGETAGLCVSCSIGKRD